MCMYISVCICIRLYSKTRGWRPESKFLIEIDLEKKGKKKSTSLVEKRNRNFELSLESRGGGVHREPLELRVISVLSCYDVGKSLKKISI